MATEDTAGGARKATKSKLFEFLVHGVVSGAVHHSLEESWHVCVCVYVCMGRRSSSGLCVRDSWVKLAM